MRNSAKNSESCGRGIADKVMLRCLCRSLALLGPREMSDVSPQSGPKRTLIKSLSPIAIFMSTSSRAPTLLLFVRFGGRTQALQLSASSREHPAQAGGRSLGLCHFALSPEPATLRQTFARRRQTAGSLIAKASFSQCRCAVGAYSNGSSTCRNKRSSRYIAGYDNRNLVLG